MPSAVRFDAEATAEIEDGVDNLSPLHVVLAISNKAAVDLDLFEAEIAELRQAGKTGTESSSAMRIPALCKSDTIVIPISVSRTKALSVISISNLCGGSRR